MESNTNSSGLISLLYEETPLKPRIHPVNVKSVFPVYVIISLPILMSP